MNLADLASVRPKRVKELYSANKGGDAGAVHVPFEVLQKCSAKLVPVYIERERDGYR